jgi:ribosome-associated protein
MTKNKKSAGPDKLELILEALKEKKGKEIVTINLEKVDHAICDYFVICHGESTTQVDALSEAVYAKLKSEHKIVAHHIEGKENSLWILIDYFDIVVHVFLQEKRSFYNLEDLWADGKLERIEDK